MPVFADGQKLTSVEWSRLIQSIPASYVVWKDGTTYRAECLLSGGTDYSGTTKATVQQNAVDALSSGGTIYLKEITLDGTVTYGNSILIIEDYQGARKIYTNQGKHLACPLLSSDPSTTGWGATQKGFWWFNTVSNVYKYWNGSEILTFEATAGAGAHNILSATHLDALVESVLAGDIIIGNSTPKWSRLAKGNDGQYFKVVSGLPSWADPPGTADHNLLSTTHPDTLAAAVVRGDLLVGNSTPKWARLPKGLQYYVLVMGASDPAWALLTNNNIDAAAAIAESKLALNYPTHPQAHTLASHSTKAHSELTNIGENDHHTKFTTVEHDTTLRHTLGTVVPHDALASLTEKSHANLTNVTEDQHHAKNHDFLSAPHPDTLAAAVVRGDLIVGNATPKWSRLAKGAANTFLKSDGTDLGWGSIEETASYIIFKVDTTYYAKNGQTGALDYSGTDAATVINNAIIATPLYGSVILKGEITITSPITLDGTGEPRKDKWFSLIFDRINVNANVNGIVVRKWTRPLIIQGRILYTEFANHNCALLKFEGLINHADVDIGQLNGDMTYGKTKGIQIEGDTGTAFMNNTIRLKCAYYVEKVLYMHFISNSWASINTFHLGFFEGLSPRQIHLYKEGTDAIHQNVIKGSGGDITKWNPQSLTPVWTIRLETDATGEIVGTTFEDFNIYSIKQEGYREIGNVSRTRFIGGMLPVDFQDYFYGSGSIDFISISLGGVGSTRLYTDLSQENSGTATIANGTASIVVAHGLAGTPTVVFATGRDLETDEVRCSARDATNITLAVPANVTADRVVDWYAEYKP